MTNDLVHANPSTAKPRYASGLGSEPTVSIIAAGAIRTPAAFGVVLSSSYTAVGMP